MLSTPSTQHSAAQQPGAPVERVVHAGRVHALEGEAVDLQALRRRALLVMVNVEDWGREKGGRQQREGVSAGSGNFEKGAMIIV